MAFTPVNLPIQEILQTDFIVDIAQIHNSNVLLLKDKLEDIINNFEIDSTSLSIGTDNPINKLNTTDIVIQDGGLIFQTGIPNQIIARLSKNVSSESVLNIDNLTVDNSVSTNILTANTIDVSGVANFSGLSTFTDSLKYESSLIESKENVTVLVEKIGFDAIGTLTLTNTSRKNIHITLNAETTIGTTQVFTSGAYNGTISNIILNIDFDENNPPEENTTFTIYILDIIAGSTSVISYVNTQATPFKIDAGINQSTTNTIIMHDGLIGSTFGNNPSSNALSKYGHNATFNYIIDTDLADRLIITSAMGLEIY